MKGICKSCDHILPLKDGECYRCRHASDDLWVVAAIVMVVVGVLLALFGVDALFDSVVKLTMAGW